MKLREESPMCHEKLLERLDAHEQILADLNRSMRSGIYSTDLITAIDYHLHLIEEINRLLDEFPLHLEYRSLFHRLRRIFNY